MSVMQYQAEFPFPAARIELSLEVGDEPVALREYAIVVDVNDPEGVSIPKALLNWGYSAPLGGCYQYVPQTSAGRPARISLPVIAERPIGRLEVKVVAWKPIIPGTDPHDIFDKLVVTFSPAGSDLHPARFSTVRRSERV